MPSPQYTRSPSWVPTERDETPPAIDSIDTNKLPLMIKSAVRSSPSASVVDPDGSQDSYVEPGYGTPLNYTPIRLPSKAEDTTRGLDFNPCHPEFPDVLHEPTTAPEAVPFAVAPPSNAVIEPGRSLFLPPPESTSSPSRFLQFGSESPLAQTTKSAQEASVRTGADTQATIDAPVAVIANASEVDALPERQPTGKSAPRPPLHAATTASKSPLTSTRPDPPIRRTNKPGTSVEAGAALTGSLKSHVRKRPHERESLATVSEDMADAVAGPSKPAKRRKQDDDDEYAPVQRARPQAPRKSAAATRTHRPASHAAAQSAFAQATKRAPTPVRQSALVSQPNVEEDEALVRSLQTGLRRIRKPSRGRASEAVPSAGLMVMAGPVAKPRLRSARRQQDDGGNYESDAEETVEQPTSKLAAKASSSKKRPRGSASADEYEDAPHRRAKKPKVARNAVAAEVDELEDGHEVGEEAASRLTPAEAWAFVYYGDTGRIPRPKDVRSGAPVSCERCGPESSFINWPTYEKHALHSCPAVEERLEPAKATLPTDLQSDKFGPMFCTRCGDSYTSDHALKRHFHICVPNDDGAWLKRRIDAWCKVWKFNPAVDPPGRRTFKLPKVKA